MIYIEFVKESDVKSFVNLIHYNPFDSKEGLGKTEKQLRLTGALIESLPAREMQSGKDAMLYYNPQTSEVWYEYVDVSLPAEERIAQLEVELAEAKAENLTIMDAVAQVYEELQVLKGGSTGG
ncbi:hypothetical protein QZ287_23460 [Brevibacillus laterosporus]|uniref:hypothetical protein n=1 Tax=Brevibacillus laterosporus TaxID=1465 RepID=UPI00265C5AAC|nr:hypothetical protein [Brevibacillus laterosporus]MDO0943961.1 hypothetical protein [Brevibacillus laterosporus]